MRLVVASSCLFLSVMTALGQTDRGTITGTVSDPAGAVIASAVIEARNQDTGTIYPAASSATGNYTLAQLPAGTYELAVSVPGFKKYVRPGIEVSVAVTVRVDAELEVGSSTESVTVQAAAPLLKTESGEVSHVVTADQANQLPVLSISPAGAGFGAIRNPLQVTTLLPGVQFSADFNLRVNGMPSNTESIRIEGQDATNGIWRQNTTISQVGMDAVQEVAVQTSNYAAEYGQAAGGYFNFTMKSGTNQFHGSAYDYLVNEVFNAGTPYTDAGITNSNKAGEHVRNRQRRTDYGFTIGGPVWIPKVYDGHDRTFFFFNFEQFRETQGVSNGLQTVPTLAYRNGNFATSTPVCVTASAACPGGAGSSQFLTQNGAAAKDQLGRPIPQFGVYDPASTFTAPDGSLARNLFPNGAVPMDRVDPVALKIQSMLPSPTNSGLINNYNVPFYTNTKVTSNPSIKMDHSLSSTMKISGYFSRQLTFQPNHNGLNEVLTGVAPTDNRSTTVRINFDYTVRPTLLFHIGIGYLYTYNPGLPQRFDQSTIGLKGFYSNTFPNFTGLNNTTTGGAGLTVGAGTFANQVQWDQKPTANINLTWVKNNHTYKFGGEMMVDGVINHTDARANGIFGVSADQTRNLWENGVPGLNSNSGFGYASFLLGTANSLTTAPPAQMRLGNHSMSFFAQDTWKVARNLTVDYGLRYDFQTYLREQYGRMQSADFDTFNPTVGFPGTVNMKATVRAAVTVVSHITTRMPLDRVWVWPTNSPRKPSCVAGWL